MGGFFSDLRTVVGLAALRRVGRKVLEDDCFGLAGQMTYFVLLSLFPLLMFLAALAGLWTEDPESALATLTRTMRGFLPQGAAELLADYIDRTLRDAGAGVLAFGIAATLWSGSAASHALIKASNRAYGLRETRPLWKVTGVAVLMVLCFVLLVGALALVIFRPETGGLLQRTAGLPDFALDVWSIARWVAAFVAVTLAHSVLYYVAPDADLPFRWITPGGLAATVLILVSSVVLSFYVANLGRYDQLYGQAGAVIVLMLWLYVGSFMAIVGVEINAVLALMAEEREAADIVRASGSAEE